MRRVGGHVASDDPIGAAKAIDADAVQIFLGNPQAWSGRGHADPEWSAQLRERARTEDIAIYVHAPYVINVASSNNRVRIPSRKLLQQQIDAAVDVGAAGLVVHGGYVTADDDPGVGYRNWRKAAEQVDLKCPVFIENTAGGRNAMARYVDAWAKLWEAVGDSGMGCCFDTCHAWAAGIGLPDGVDEIRRITGRIDLVHANDSVGEFGTGRDRHAHLGSGTIGAERIVAACVSAGAPVICETSSAGIARDIAVVRAGLAA